METGVTVQYIVVYRCNQLIPARVNAGIEAVCLFSRAFQSMCHSHFDRREKSQTTVVKDEMPPIVGMTADSNPERVFVT
ncbi:MAG: hypothetical protein KZQ84_14385 [Candidatus Thiodiazotropha sp. (ex Lucinoma borealis)]|nr:hypothetical protein [Candidatus Thiodiazotropha sp. (ex Lucinoma borealis)]